MKSSIARAGWLEALDRDGFAIVPGVMAENAVNRLVDALAVADGGEAIRRRNQQTYAVRNVLSLCPEVRRAAESPPIRGLAEGVLGPAARAVRGILFDKTAGANWKVAWHQDLSIAVKRPVEAAGFGPWSRKAGVPHVQPPVQLLENMLTVRLHLDDCGPDNGPLKVIPGSHRFGTLTAKEIDEQVAQNSPRVCCLHCGGALLMRPLLLHASSSATKAGHRRVVHLEFAAWSLPPELEWAEQV